MHKFLSLPHGLIRASRNIAEFFCASWQLRSNARSTHRPPQSKLTVRTWRDQQRSGFAPHAWKNRSNVQKFNKARTGGPTYGLPTGRSHTFGTVCARRSVQKSQMTRTSVPQSVSGIVKTLNLK